MNTTLRIPEESSIRILSHPEANLGESRCPRQENKQKASFTMILLLFCSPDAFFTIIMSVIIQYKGQDRYNLSLVVYIFYNALIRWTTAWLSDSASLTFFMLVARDQAFPLDQPSFCHVGCDRTPFSFSSCFLVLGGDRPKQELFALRTTTHKDSNTTIPEKQRFYNIL